MKKELNDLSIEEQKEHLILTAVNSIQYVLVMAGFLICAIIVHDVITRWVFILGILASWIVGHCDEKKINKLFGL